MEFSNPKEKDAEKLIAKYNEIKRKLRYNLSYNSFATEMLNTVNYNYNEEKRVYDVDISPVLGYIKTVYDIDNFKGELLLCDVVDVLKFTKSKMSFNKVEFNKEILDKIKSYGKVDGDKFQQLLFKVDDEKFYPFDLIKDEKPSELTMEEEKTPSIPVSDKIIDEIIENKEAISEIKKDEQEVTKEVKVKEVVENNENATEKALEVMEEIKQEEEKITK
ncbi:MAG: hypothetical protein BWY78_00912 [Alphaproteobacteria bacterium ADurb.Bin438]|nr:MAG: hypothetical protein BWY78_00912 [Alphaproteobacteria bacterium ADurb.Bin438]